MSFQDIVPYRVVNVKNKRLLDPHVVIVGAGASIAACRFDKNCVEVPLLKNIHTVLGLEPELCKYGFSKEELSDFEMLYSHLCNQPKWAKLVNYLEDAVRKYFQQLQLPDFPTYYDYLVLSLTSKDAIISFNWDPFLLQAYE